MIHDHNILQLEQVEGDDTVAQSQHKATQTKKNFCYIHT